MNAQVKPEPKAPRQVKLSKEAVFIDGQLSHIALEYADGTKATVEVPLGVFQEAAATGALYKLGQLSSGEEDLETLKTSVMELVTQWHAGEWRQRAEGGSGTSIIQKAIMEYRGKTANEARDFLATKTMEEKVAIKRIPALAVIVARLEAEEAARLLAKGKVAPATESLLEGL